MQPNLAFEGKDLDANFFQHKPYLDDFNKEKGTKLVSSVRCTTSPSAFTPARRSLGRTEGRRMVAVPNDTTNEARALLLLQIQRASSS